MILVLFAHCVVGGVHGEKIRKFSVRQHPSAPKAATVTNIRRAAAASCSFSTVPRVASEGEQEVAPENILF